MIEDGDCVFIDCVRNRFERLLHIVDFLFETADTSSKPADGIFDVIEPFVENNEMLVDAVEAMFDTLETALHYFNDVLQCRLGFTFHAPQYTRAVPCQAGNSAMKVEPLPCPSDSARMVPLCASVICFAM